MLHTIYEVVTTVVTLDPLTGAAHGRVLDLHKLSITEDGSREDQEKMTPMKPLMLTRSCVGARLVAQGAADAGAHT